MSSHQVVMFARAIPCVCVWVLIKSRMGVGERERVSMYLYINVYSWIDNCMC